MVEIITVALFLIPIFVTLILKRYLEGKKEDISLKEEELNAIQNEFSAEEASSKKDDDTFLSPLQKAMREADEKRAKGEKIPWDEDPYLAHIPGNKYNVEYSQEYG